jgi:hypothetical protein
MIEKLLLVAALAIAFVLATAGLASQSASAAPAAGVGVEHAHFSGDAHAGAHAAALDCDDHGTAGHSDDAGGAHCGVTGYAALANPACYGLRSPRAERLAPHEGHARANGFFQPLFRPPRFRA